ERAVVAPLERDGKEHRRREAVQDDGAVEAFERRRGLRVGGARVHDNRLPQLGGDLELALEEPPLRVPRGVIAEEVEPGLADRDRALVAKEATQLPHALRVVSVRLMRMDSERRE